jgi:hypothetical protein
MMIVIAFGVCLGLMLFIMVMAGCLIDGYNIALALCCLLIAAPFIVGIAMSLVP